MQVPAINAIAINKYSLPVSVQAGRRWESFVAYLADVRLLSSVGAVVTLQQTWPIYIKNNMIKVYWPGEKNQHEYSTKK